MAIYVPKPRLAALAQKQEEEVTNKREVGQQEVGQEEEDWTPASPRHFKKVITFKSIL